MRGVGHGLSVGAHRAGGLTNRLIIRRGPAVEVGAGKRRRVGREDHRLGGGGAFCCGQVGCARIPRAEDKRVILGLNDLGRRASYGEELGVFRFPQPLPIDESLGRGCNRRPAKHRHIPAHELAPGGDGGRSAKRQRGLVGGQHLRIRADINAVEIIHHAEFVGFNRAVFNDRACDGRGVFERFDECVSLNAMFILEFGRDRIERAAVARPSDSLAVCKQSRSLIPAVEMIAGFQAHGLQGGFICGKGPGGCGGVCREAARGIRPCIGELIDINLAHNLLDRAGDGEFIVAFD